MGEKDLLVIGRVARAHGNKGQVIVNLETDFPGERFAPGARVLVGATEEPRTITSVRFHQGRPVIGLEGVNSMDEADALAGAELQVPADSLPALPEGTYHRHDLVGCEVRDVRGGIIGVVSAVEGPMETSRLVIDAPHGEVLIPLVADICVEVAPAEKRITVQMPEGLLDVNRTAAGDV
jgi:16S rRNA processing protein RimM